jgi:hypothetical protein
MKRLAFMLVLVAAACDQQAPLRFDKTWVAGEMTAARRDANSTAVTIQLRLGDAEAFGKEFHIRPPLGFQCQNVRLVYRNTPQSDPRILTTQWSHSGWLHTSEPQVCLHRGVDWQWQVLLAHERGELPLDLDGRLVLITGEEPNPREEIAVVVLRRELQPTEAARSEWVPLRRR